jgi:ferric-dicitrate binding protein FerR (iron transport regulator)
MDEALLHILTLYLNDEALTAAQEQTLQQWKAASPYYEEALELLTDNAFLRNAIRQREAYAARQYQNWEKLQQQVSGKKRPLHVLSTKRGKWQPWLAAAGIVIAVATGAGFLYQWRNNVPQHSKTGNNIIAGQNISPGQNGALLQLADGTLLILDKMENGVVAEQTGARVVFNNGGLIYTPTGSNALKAVYNTITTPRGRQFSVVLPDGTRAWLNTASSIHYPTAFAANERVVSITGEVYFEVAPKARVPFRVNISKHTTVDVLGTSFNINAYGNEDRLTVTLLKGSVRVAQRAFPGQPPAILAPGQQALLQQTSPDNGHMAGISVIHNADTSKAMAWKNGFFNFEATTLREMMRQLERWYDIEVIYEGAVPDIQFFGKMSKAVQLSDLLEGLKTSGIHFRIEAGRKLVVMP